MIGSYHFEHAAEREHVLAGFQAALEGREHIRAKDAARSGPGS
jgi:hypothetical protein